MKHPMFVKSVIVIAVSQALLQSVAAQPASSASDAPPVLQAPGILIGPKSSRASEEEQGGETRILRGTDKVLEVAPSAPIPKGAPVSFNFEEAPVTEVVRTILGDMLKLDYVMHPPLQGTVTRLRRLTAIAV